MKKIFALAIVLGLAACAPKETPAPAVDTTATVAPAADSMAADTTRADSTAPAAPAAQ